MANFRFADCSSSGRQQSETERSGRSTSCAGLGAGEHFATAKKYSSSPLQFDRHSYRKATIGSTFVARRPGT
jgi:hypothetical protein